MPSAKRLQFAPLTPKAQSAVDPAHTTSPAVSAGSDKPLRVVLIAGEASGDYLGEGVLRALTQLSSQQGQQVQVAGIFGPLMQRAASADSFLPMADLAVNGLGAVLLNLPKLVGHLNATTAAILGAKPDVVLSIDAQDFAMRLGRRIRQADPKRQIKLVHLVAPTVWAKRPERAEQLAQYLDHLLCLYPFEPELFERHGLASTFVGHRGVGEFVLPTPGSFRTAQGLDESTPLLTLLPGSRRSEIKWLLPKFLTAFELMSQQLPTLRAFMPVAAVVAEDVEAIIAPWRAQNSAMGNRLGCLHDPALKWQLFSDSDAALAAVGTVSMELALTKTAAVLAYDGGWLTRRYFRQWNNYSSIPSIIAGREIQKELRWDDSAPQNLAASILDLLKDKPKAKEVGESSHEAVMTLARRDPNGQIQNASTLAAEVILKLAQG